MGLGVGGQPGWSGRETRSKEHYDALIRFREKKNRIPFLDLVKLVVNLTVEALEPDRRVVYPSYSLLFSSL